MRAPTPPRSPTSIVPDGTNKNSSQENSIDIVAAAGRDSSPADASAEGDPDAGQVPGSTEYSSR